MYRVSILANEANRAQSGRAKPALHPGGWHLHVICVRKLLTPITARSVPVVASRPNRSPRLKISQQARPSYFTPGGISVWRRNGTVLAVTAISDPSRCMDTGPDHARGLHRRCAVPGSGLGPAQLHRCVAALGALRVAAPHCNVRLSAEHENS